MVSKMIEQFLRWVQTGSSAARGDHGIPSPCVVAETDGWSVFLPGLPIAADGTTFDAAVDEMVQALREYAEDWQARLRGAPNHRNNGDLVQLISLRDDDQLREWVAWSAQRDDPAFLSESEQIGRIVVDADRLGDGQSA
jgi:hypothetical protein